MLVYQRVSHVGCLLTIGFPTLINHLWTLKRDWISSSSVLHSGIVDYIYFMRFHPYFVYITRFLVTHFWWRSPQQKHVQLPRARLRDPAAAARLSRAPLRVCTPHRSPSAVLYFGRQKLVGSGSPLPRKTIKSQGFNWVDCSWLSIDTEEIPWVFTIQGELRDAAQVVFPLQSKRKGMCRPRRTDEDKWVQEICSKVGGIEVDSIGTCSQRLW